MRYKTLRRRRARSQLAPLASARARASAREQAKLRLSARTQLSAVGFARCILTAYHPSRHTRYTRASQPADRPTNEATNRKRR